MSPTTLDPGPGTTGAGTPEAGSSEAGPAAAGPTALDPTTLDRWREWRVPLAIIMFVLLAGTAIALLQPGPAVAGYLSPDAKGPGGTHALADILTERGHGVQTVTSAGAAVAAVAPGTTLVITSPYLLTAGELRALGRTPASLVIAEPDPAALATLAPQVTQDGGAPVGPLLPACALRAATLAGPADLGGPGLRVRPGTPGVAQCYISDGLATLVQFRSGGRLITVLSTGDPLTNAYLARQGNAALAINLLSSGGRIVWLVPSFPSGPAAGDGGSRSFGSLVPLAARLVAIQLGVALLLTALWRARRLGPLITERLPVVVRASETVEGHARLYQSRHARDRVAAALRAAALTRVLPAIGLPPAAAPAAVTAALAARSTLDEARVADLLYGPAPGSDAALITLASDLDALEGEVRR
ncbi:MAG TPA: DUF4350 domain-containing protein [Streptosporangiaceae bacterium]|nr:DUF4350 domain-containing protein [Streptosporangiaceae bacterium]